MNPNQFRRGDHLVSPRLGYSHHGLYLGNDQVIHYTGFSDGQHEGRIAFTSLAEFCSGRNCEVQTHTVRIYSVEESLDRACSRLGEDWYDVLLNNCEHFVNWCIQGLHASQQVNQLIAAAALTRKLLTSTTSAQATIAQATASSIASAGTVCGVAVGSSLIAGSGVGTTIAAGIAATSAAPVVGVIGAGVAVGYGVKKLVDWLWD